MRKQNRITRPGGFLLTKKDLREAAAKASGIWGAFHSHPIWQAAPSSGDITGGPCDGHAIIYDLIGDEFRLWRISRYKWELLKSFDFDRSWLFEVGDD